MRSGFVAIIGKPNIGKSTLLNRLIGENVAIVTEKPQTTRNTIRGIYTDEEKDCQIVFIDTPGLHKGKTKLDHFMTDQALGTFGEVDAIIFMVDSLADKSPADRHIIELIKELDTPKLLVINKIDEMDADRFKAVFDSYDEMGIFQYVTGISALNGTNTDELLDTVMSMMPEGPAYFPADMFTDHPFRFLVSEIIREKLLLYLEHEVPHGVAVEIESFVEKENITEIGAVIYCDKKSHKGIIIGKNGRKLKGIGKSAREEIENLMGTKVYLRLWVKVKENWKDSDMALSDFGYK